MQQQSGMDELTAKIPCRQVTLRLPDWVLNLEDKQRISIAGYLLLPRCVKRYPHLPQLWQAALDWLQPHGVVPQEQLAVMTRWKLAELSSSCLRSLPVGQAKWVTVFLLLGFAMQQALGACFKLNPVARQAHLQLVQAFRQALCGRLPPEAIIVLPAHVQSLARALSAFYSALIAQSRESGWLYFETNYQRFFCEEVAAYLAGLLCKQRLTVLDHTLLPENYLGLRRFTIAGKLGFYLCATLLNLNLSGIFKQHPALARMITGDANLLEAYFNALVSLRKEARSYRDKRNDNQVLVRYRNYWQQGVAKPLAKAVQDNFVLHNSTMANWLLNQCLIQHAMRCHPDVSAYVDVLLSSLVDNVRWSCESSERYFKPAERQIISQHMQESEKKITLAQVSQAGLQDPCCIESNGRSGGLPSRAILVSCLVCIGVAWSQRTYISQMSGGICAGLSQLWQKLSVQMEVHRETPR